MMNNNYNDTVISTRVRLARNINDIAFPHRLSKSEKLNVIELVRSALLDSNTVIANDFDLIKMWELSKIDALALVEKHLISPEFIKNTEGRAVLINKDETVSIMINEEDHIRLQVIMQGFEPEKALDLTDKLDTLLDERLHFAFNERLGYLTQCPTNLGTGLRVSVMLHLPAIKSTNAINRIANNLSKLGMTIRGIYGEGSEPVGSMYQLSNQVSLGISEKAAVDNLKNIAIQLINLEKQEQENLLKNIDIQDKIARSLGLLKFCRSISHSESMQLLSNIKLGIISGEIDNISIEDINKLIIQIQPANIMKLAGRELTPAERDKERANLIRNSI